MNSVYFRLAFYLLAPLAGVFGFGSFDSTTGILTIDVNQLAYVLGAAVTGTAVVFGIWGKK